MHIPLTTADFMRRAATVYGARTAILDEPNAPGGDRGTISFAQLEALARAQAAGLDRLGIEPGERVAIVSKNAARLLVSMFGVTAFGRILVPVNFRLKPDEVAYIVAHSGARVLLVDPELEAALADVKCEHRFVLGEPSDHVLFPRDLEPSPWEADESATATINYTSGTTARPKGVQLTHRNLWINATVFGLHIGVSDRDVYLHTLPMFHCNGWGLPFILAGMGARQIVLRQVDGAEILRRVEQHGVTLLCGAPAVAARILGAATSWSGEIPGRDRLRMVVAGAPPPTRLIERMEFIQIYGLTETSPLATINRGRDEYEARPSEERAGKLGRAGAPSLGVDVRILDDGEVLLRGNVICEGYWDDPAATAATIREGWFHTGDGGYLDEEQYLHITDRKKDIIISGGENISSIEVEDVLFSHPAVSEVAVIGVPDEKWGETVKALVVLSAGQTADAEALIQFCRARLAHYKCPTSVELRASLPRTATGKLQKFKLRAPYWQGHEKRVN